VKKPGLMMTGSAPLGCPLDMTSGLSIINIACSGSKIKHHKGCSVSVARLDFFIDPF
jgi:hypothetical protein